MREYPLASFVALAVACLVSAPGARAQVADISGDYTLEIDAMAPQSGLACRYAGTATLVQDGSELSGTATLSETKENPSCPLMPSAIAAGSVDGSSVTLNWVGADGTGNSMGTLSNDNLLLRGSVAVTAGPFTSLTGDFTAERVIPEVAGNWRWTATLEQAAPCEYAGEGVLTRDVNQLGGTATLSLVSGDVGSCPAMPMASVTGTIDPAGNLDVQLSGQQGTGEIIGTASPRGTALTGSFSIKSGPFLGGGGTFRGERLGSAVPSLTLVAIALLFGALLAVALVVFRRRVRQAPIQAR